MAMVKTCYFLFSSSISSTLLAPSYTNWVLSILSMSGANRLATAPIPSSSLIFSINLPRFFLVGDNFFRFASALIISPDTNTGSPRFAATLDARLLPAPGIPTTTMTVFDFALSMQVSGEPDEDGVIALKNGSDYLRQRFVRGTSPKLHLDRPRRSTDSIPNIIDPVISAIAGWRFETCRAREHPSHVEISRKRTRAPTGRSQVLPTTGHLFSVHGGDQRSWRLSKSQPYECSLGWRERGLESSRADLRAGGEAIVRSRLPARTPPL